MTEIKVSSETFEENTIDFYFHRGKFYIPYLSYLNVCNGNSNGYLGLDDKLKISVDICVHEKFYEWLLAKVDELKVRLMTLGAESIQEKTKIVDKTSSGYLIFITHAKLLMFHYSPPSNPMTSYWSCNEAAAEYVVQVLGEIDEKNMSDLNSKIVCHLSQFNIISKWIIASHTIINWDYLLKGLIGDDHVNCERFPVLTKEKLIMIRDITKKHYL